MTQGIFVRGRRPKSKKEVKEMAREDPSRVSLEATDMMGKEYDGPINEAPVGLYFFVGPDPYRKRNFYGQIEVRNDKIVVR